MAATPAPVAPAPAAPTPPKPVLKLNPLPPTATAANPARIAAAQKLPGRTPVVTTDEDAPSPVLTVLSGLAAATAITFAVLLFLKTK
jgi:hypothetical protein